MLTISKYLTVGVVNTLTTLFIIMSLTAIGISLYFANFIGYAFGVALSFYLNSRFTFNQSPSLKRAILFLGVVFICYLMNLLIIYISIQLGFGDYISQVFGMISYTFVGFVLNKIYTFR